MRQKTIYYLKTSHSSKESKKDVTSFFSKHSVDVVFCEGVKNPGLCFKHWIREPLLIIFVKVYFWFLKIFGSEMSLAEKIALEKKIPVINMDIPLSELILSFYSPLHYFFWLLVVFVLSWLMYKYSLFPYWFLILVILALSASVSLVYLYCFHRSVFNMRNKRFKDTVKQQMKRDEYNNALMIFGNKHKEVMKPLSKYFKIMDVKQLLAKEKNYKEV